MPIFWFMVKVLALLFGTVWLRASLPRMRYDQLMSLGWKYLIEIAILWVLVSATIVRRAARRTGTCWVALPVAVALALVAYGDALLVDAEVGRGGRGVPLMGRFSGFRVTLRQMFKPRLTTEYPKEKSAKPERLHGRHVLNRYEDGMEKCIGCELCAGVCPARCIYVRGADNPIDDPVSPGRALRLRLRDQLPALHPLRPVRRGVPDRGDHRDEAVRVLVHEPRRRDLHEGPAARRRRRRAPRMPWELWVGGEDDHTSAWMRATSPSGAAAYEGRVELVGRARLRRAPARAGQAEPRRRSTSRSRPQEHDE